MTQERYAVLSLEQHMFFARIMMEHALFLESRLMPADSELSKAAEWYRQQFEAVLYHSVILGDGIVSTEVLSSGEIVTAYTLASEQLSQYFTGIAINQDITMMEEKLKCAENPEITQALIEQVRQLNAAAKPLIDGIHKFKSKVLIELQACRAFIADYPLLVRSMLGETLDYGNRLSALENSSEHHNKQDVLLFWKQGMLERMISFRSMFDPTEKEMVTIADGFAHRYSHLMLETRMMGDALTPHVLTAALKEVVDYRDFMDAVVENIVACKIQSAMLPQMADHSLRETNCFIRLLKQQIDIANSLQQ